LKKPTLFFQDATKSKARKCDPFTGRKSYGFGDRVAKKEGEAQKVKRDM